MADAPTGLSRPPAEGPRIASDMGGRHCIGHRTLLSPLGRGLTLWAFWCNLLHLSHPSTLEHFHSLAIFGFVGFLQRHGNFHFFFLGDLGSMPHFHSLLHGGILSSSLNMSPSLTLSLWAPRGSLTPQAGAMPPSLSSSLKKR